MRSKMSSTSKLYTFSKRFWIILAFWLGSLFYLLFQGGKTAFMLLGMASVLTVYLTMGYWSGISRARGTRVLEQGGIPRNVFHSGEQLKAKLHVQIPGLWTTPYVVLKDRLFRRNGETLEFETLLLSHWNRSGSMEYVTPPLRRGIYTFGETECVTEDIFGLFEHKGVFKVPGHFSVFPQTVEIRNWKLFDRRRAGYARQALLNRSFKETTQINGVREYIYGDRISRIHWNATAKTGEWKSKEFERESLPVTIIVFDRNKDNYADAEQFELAVSVTASLIEYGAKRNIPMGLYSYGKSIQMFQAVQTPQNRKQILEHLLEAEADGDEPLLPRLQSDARSLGNGSVYAIVSPRADDAMLQLLRWAQRMQLVPCHLHIDGSHGTSGWLPMIRSQGHLGYSVSALEDLPKVLGG
ncbi:MULTISPECIES: DUF58 domain-containing protein [unclassified Paenibacillus]|uniref:DUF58 domain-containing protein n=1 Tax=unclassified Paenibacillus TaxID=185978 RepID=UPI001C103D25|nr:MULTISPECIES: DUF58 domain-containing protein [unclassified Paenibacillus]MBU5444285.1 DUF58 domain-containing protein [Paenibacillus sp. MSJ-34]CAH0121014.1 hypothetical protein PAE9249_03539 [Paenibacillus sp. CECT 9249]